MELTVERLEEIIEKAIGNGYGKISSTTLDREEVLSCLYARISRILDDNDTISHEGLISICDKTFKGFELHIRYDRNKYPDSTLRQFEYIVNQLLSMKRVKINSVAAKMAANSLM